MSDTIWLQGPEWLRMPSQFWPKSDNEDTIDSSELEYRKSNSVIQN